MISPRILVAGQTVQLRKLRYRDAAALQAQVSHPEVVRWTTRIPHPYPADGAIRFIRSSVALWRLGRAYVFGVLVSGSPEACGVISLSSVSRAHACAELGFWLGCRHWGKGLGTEAVRLMLEFGFDDLQLHRIYASAFAANVASRRVLEKNGFRLEGVLREAVVRFGERQDFCNYGLLRPEWLARRPAAAGAGEPPPDPRNES
ncbi:MAG: GNAT family N-acetyltransferase [Acidobacteriota bacterium]